MDDRTIEINMDLRCECGKRGVTKSGLCLSCVAKRVSNIRREGSKMAKKKKPLADVEIECPHCKSIVRVRVFRNRIDKPIPPEDKVCYSIWSVTRKQ